MNWLTKSIVLALALLAGCRSPWRGATADAKTEGIPAHKRNDAIVSNDPPIAQMSHSVASLKDPPADVSVQQASGAIDQSTQAWLSRGHAAFQRGDLEEAKSLYRQVLAEYSDHPVAHHRLAIIADRQKEFDIADFHYDMARRSMGPDADLLNDMGYSHLLRGDYAESEQLLRQAIVLRPTHRDALNNLGHLFAKQGKYSAAESMLRLANTEAEAQAVLAQHFPNGIDPTAIVSAELESTDESLEPLCAPDLRPDESPGPQRPADLSSRYASAITPHAGNSPVAVPGAMITEIVPYELAEHAELQVTAELSASRMIQPTSEGPQPAGSIGATIDLAGALSEIHAAGRLQPAANSVQAASVGAGARQELPGASAPVDPLESMPLWPQASPGIAGQTDAPRIGGTSYDLRQHGEHRYPAERETKDYKEARNAGEY